MTKPIETSFFGRKRVPVILQSEAAECGLACVAMLATHWGRNTSVSEIRRNNAVSLKGATLRSIVTMCSELGLKARPIKVSLSELKSLPEPSIIHWDLKHFVILESISRGRARIIDPQIGALSLSIEEVSRHFTGIAVEVAPASGFERGAGTPDPSLRSVIGTTRGLSYGIARLVAVSILIQLLLLAAPLYMQLAIDEAASSGDLHLLTILAAGFASLLVLRTGLSALRSWLGSLLAVDFGSQWMRNVFVHMLRLPVRYFLSRHLGDVVSRFGSIATIQRAITTDFVESFIDGLLIVTTLILMLFYSVWLALLAGAAVSLYALSRFLMFSAERSAQSDQIVHESRQNTHFIESVRGIQSIRLHEREAHRSEQWYGTLVHQLNAQIKLSRVQIVFSGVNAIVFGAEIIGSVFLAVTFFVRGDLSLGMIFAYIAYKTEFMARAGSLVDRILGWKMLKLHVARVSDITTAEPELTDTHNGEDLAAAPTIEFRGVSFRYSNSDPYALKDVNLLIQAGQGVALTGPSGCGKSTLLKIALGLLEPTDGAVFVDGVELRRFGVSRLRRASGSVMQDDSLFSGTIAENISFFDENPDETWVRQCAANAAIMGEIAAMPMELNSLIGDIGSGLSGGQKQRLLLARALYRRPHLFVLDEATSHLDPMNELIVNSSIKQLSATRLIAAHRQETIALTDRVVRLEGGCIVSDELQDSGNCAQVTVKITAD